MNKTLQRRATLSSRVLWVGALLPAACSTPNTMPPDDASVDRAPIDGAAVEPDASAAEDGASAMDASAMDTSADGASASDSASSIDASEDGATTPADSASVDSASVDSAVSDSGVAPDVRCPAAQQLCSGACVDTASNAMHCGACGVACTMGRVCEVGVCRVPCAAGEHHVGDACVADGGVRPIVPLSLGDTSLRRPTLRFALPMGADGAVVELCRDRACTMVIETLRIAGTSARPSAALPASSVVFWRARARVGATEDTVANNGPTWLFHTPARDNTGAVDTSTHPHLDVNGDGFDDVIIGSPGADPSGRFGAGTATIVHGSATGLAATPARVLEGLATNDAFGMAVSNAGDVNGDGFADVIVGAPNAQARGFNRAGTSRVFHGSPSGVSATAAVTIDGFYASAYSGSALACAGDVDADGYADVIVGAYGASPGSLSQAGTASVYHGSARGLRTPATLVLQGVSPTVRLGWSVASAGDVNGDGFSDIIVGVPSGSASGRSQAGDAMVHLGGATGVSASAQRTLSGSGAVAYFGHSVSSAGDVNNDGYSDVVIGAPRTTTGACDFCGSASVFRGSASGIGATASRRLDGPSSGSNFGNQVCRVGDVDQDGSSDIAVASPNTASDQVSVYLGSGIPAFALTSTRRGDRFGEALNTAGDVNGDGRSDLIVGAPGVIAPTIMTAGSASVFHGDAARLQSTAARVFVGTDVEDDFGYSVGR
ncbi:MAG: FG-GAP-like repeat-containing protein [Polyangiales bacterium]